MYSTPTVEDSRISFADELAALLGRFVPCDCPDNPPESCPACGGSGWTLSGPTASDREWSASNLNPDGGWAEGEPDGSAIELRTVSALDHHSDEYDSYENSPSGRWEFPELAEALGHRAYGLTEGGGL